MGTRIEKRKYSSFYGVYLSAVGKSPAGFGAYGIIILGERGSDIFEKSFSVLGKTLPAREYLASTKSLELLRGREDKDITLNFKDERIVNQLNGEWGSSPTFERAVLEFRRAVNDFSKIRYKFVKKFNEWIV